MHDIPKVSDDCFKMLFPKVMEKYLGMNRCISVKISDTPELKHATITKNTYSKES